MVCQRWICARVDSIHAALGRWKRKGQGTPAHVAAYGEALGALQAMLTAGRDQARHRAVTALLCVRTVLGARHNVEAGLASRILAFLVQLES
jgi:hypothetical protein